jgi:hypothetical protein
VTLEPNNTSWLEVAALAHADRADALMATSRVAMARADIARAADIAENLVRRDPGVPFWAGMLTHRALLLRAELAARQGKPTQAIALASAAATGLERIYRGKKPEPDVLWVTARAQLLAGDQSLAMGERSAAKSAWTQVIASTAEDVHMGDVRLRSLRAEALTRLGRPAEAGVTAPDHPAPAASAGILAQR